MVFSGKHLFIIGLMFAVIFALVLWTNQWMSSQIRALETTDPIQPKPVSTMSSAIPQKALRKPRPVVIDAANDPLAPVMKKEEISPKKAEPENTAAPKKIFEFPMDTDILVQ